MQVICSVFRLNDIFKPVYLFIHLVGEMGELTSKLLKSEINADFSLYKTHLLKGLENNLKYYSLNSFKKIVTGFNHGLETRQFRNLQ